MNTILNSSEIEHINQVCEKYNITKYSIKPNGVVDVDGILNLSNYNLGNIPLKFGIVTGNFFCHNSKLSSLLGCPEVLGGDLFCNDNNLPLKFMELYNDLDDEEIRIFLKYQHTLRIWEDGYNEEAAQILFDEIKDGLL